MTRDVSNRWQNHSVFGHRNRRGEAEAQDRNTWSAKRATKATQHYMLKEIMDQKESVARAVNQDDEQIMTLAELLRMPTEHSSSAVAPPQSLYGR